MVKTRLPPAARVWAVWMEVSAPAWLQAGTSSWLFPADGSWGPAGVQTGSAGSLSLEALAFLHWHFPSRVDKTVLGSHP